MSSQAPRTAGRIRTKSSETRPRGLIIFDLDGTIADPTERYYLAIRNALHVAGVTSPPKEQIISLRRAGLSGREIVRRAAAHISDADLVRLEERRLAEIDAPEHLRKDTIFEYSREVLKGLKRSGFLLALLTSRNGPEARRVTMENLTKWRVSELFDEIIIADSAIATDPVVLKSQEAERILVKNHVSRADCWIIGDTPVEIEAARRLGCKSVAVLSGLSGMEILSSAEPTTIVRSLVDVMEVVGRHL